MFVGIRDLWFAKGRFALMTGVVTLVAFLVVVLSGLTGGLRAETTSAIEGLGAAHVVFAESPDGPSYQASIVDASIADTLADQRGVDAAAPLGILRTSLEQDQGADAIVVFATPLGSWLAPQGLTAGTLLVSGDFADTNGLADGQAVRVGEVDLTVAVGDVDGQHAHQPVVWTDLATWQRIVNQKDKASVVMLEGPGSPDPLPGMVVAPVDDSLSAIAGFSQEQGSLQLIQGFLLVISALVVGAFFSVWIIQRRRDIAVLKAMGASTIYLLGDAIGQAAMVVVAAAVGGGGAGFLVGILFADSVPFLSTAETIVYPLLLMSALGLVGAGLAIRSITKVDPLTALGASR